MSTLDIQFRSTSFIPKWCVNFQMMFIFFALDDVKSRLFFMLSASYFSTSWFNFCISCWLYIISLTLPCSWLCTLPPCVFFVLLDFPVRWNVTNVRTPLSLRRSSGSMSNAASSNGAERNLTCVEPLQTVQWNWVVGAKCLSTSREMWKSGVLFLSPIRLVISCCQGTSCAWFPSH